MPVVRDVSSWDRLEHVLAATKPGDVVTTDELSREIGLAMDTARIVLTALVRAELFVEIRVGSFRRQSLFPER